MRRHRFFLPDSQPGRLFPLPGDEAAHALRVLRIRPGTAVAVFDGRGREYEAVVTGADRGSVLVAVGVEVPAPAAEPAVAVTLAVAVLKGDHMDGVIRDATMLGVHALVPLVTARSETSVAALARGARRERWQRIAVSSAKQCGRSVVPAVLEPVRFEDWLAGLEGHDQPLVCVEPLAAVSSAPARDVARPSGGRATVAVGPEGGWSEEELARLAVAARCLRLGGRTLRAETAPVVALAALFAVWGVE